MTLSRREASKRLGDFGETYACHALKRRGYEIIGRNLRFTSGEIDIVAREGDELVFVEVKTRHPSPIASPEDAISEERLTHLEGAIEEYWMDHGGPRPYRIEIAAIEVDRSGKVRRFEVLGDVGLR